MASTSTSRGARLRSMILVLAIGVGLGWSPRPVAAQVAGAVLGAGGGFMAGLYTTTAIFVTKARFGHYLYSVEDLTTLRPEIIPLFAGPVAGAWLGFESGAALREAAVWGGAGFLGGAGVGVGAGHLIWRTEEGRWAGAVIGSALGMLTGTVLGARRGLEKDDDEPSGVMSFAVTIPVPGF